MGDDCTRLAFLAARLDRNPFNHWLGLRIVALGVTMHMPWRCEFVSNPDEGYVHGGVLAALIDTACSYAIGARLGVPVQTIDRRIDYHHPAMPGALRTEGRLIRVGRTLGTAEASIFDERDRLLGRGRGAFFTAGATGEASQ